MRTRRIYVLAALLVLVEPALSAPASPASPARHVSFNGHPVTKRDLVTLERLEASWGQRLDDGSYWYDSVCGAAGTWGGPAIAVLPAGLDLGGKLPANASGGGTGVFVNGRELHPVDLQNLTSVIGPISPGRYWIDAQGNAGFEGRPAVLKLPQPRVPRAPSLQLGPRPPGDPCGGHMGPYATIGRGNEIAAYCRSLGHYAGQTYHNGDGYYLDVR